MFQLSDPWLYRYPSLLSGTLIRRYKRFFAEIQLDSGEVITAHCPNTGPMTGVYNPGMAVQVSQSDNPNRKLPYTWEMIQVPQGLPAVKPGSAVEAVAQLESASAADQVWVGVNTALPNRITRQLLEQRGIASLQDYAEVRSEVTLDQTRKSRIDFLLTGGDRPIYLEVKNTTWSDGNLALFPDTVTTRGQRHLRDLMALTPTARAVMLYFINRGDCVAFAPGDSADPVYGELLRAAIAAGVEVLPCRFEVSPEGLRYLGLAPLQI